MRDTFTIETTDRVAVRDITATVADRIPDVDQGICSLFVGHTTAGICVNEAESNLLEDVIATLESLVPESAGYAHDTIDDNADAHLRAMLLGSSVTVPIRGGELDLGTWQRVLFFEGDGPRTRTVVMTVVES